MLDIQAFTEEFDLGDNEMTEDEVIAYEGAWERINRYNEAERMVTALVAVQQIEAQSNPELVAHGWVDDPWQDEREEDYEIPEEEDELEELEEEFSYDDGYFG